MLVINVLCCFSSKKRANIKKIFKKTTRRPKNLRVIRLFRLIGHHRFLRLQILFAHANVLIFQYLHILVQFH